MAAITFGAVITTVGGVISTVLNAILSTISHFGYPPLALFMIALFFLDSESNIIGGAISAVTSHFYGFTISSFFLFMFVIATLLIWFMYKARQFHGMSAYG